MAWQSAAQAGVDGVIKYFHRELVDSMLHCGVYRIPELGAKHVQPA
jgi:isopentenyl diphosphate isomerase/L-lactate dehydrogenase-like FMN-dependent dehydrogenase